MYIKSLATTGVCSALLAETMVSPTPGPDRSLTSSIDKASSNSYIETTAATDPNHKFNNARFKERLTPDQRREALRKALEVDPGVKPWTWRAIQTVLIVLVTCCCEYQCMYIAASELTLNYFMLGSGDSGFDGERCILDRLYGLLIDLMKARLWGVSTVWLNTSTTSASKGWLAFLIC